MAEPAPIFDVVIAGGGASGLALAAAIKQAMRQGASIAVVDPAAPAAASRPPLRTVAIADGPRRLLEHVGAWEAIERHAQPILSMAIMDGDVRDTVRLPHLNFATKDRGPLAHMAFNDDVVGALSALCDRLGVQRVTGSVAHWASGKYVAELGLSDGHAVRARLAVAADGARSKLSRLAEIQTIGWDYDQTGIVATVAHERDHEGRAEQHFLPAGPFAVLPLPGRQSSIVWNERRADALALLALDPDDLTRQLEYRFTPKLGAIRLASRVEAFPFRFQIARRFVAGRLALVGDAAHVVHPVAGQGLNLGLRDVAALAETIVGEMRLGLDPGAPLPLATYQRHRRFDVAASGLGLDALNRLFSNDLPPLRFIRDLGLRIVDRTPPLKGMLIAEAGGAGGGAPKLLRGLAL
jgi:2-octaprenyl-6-methoxyphenol hydroxylase